MNDSFTGAHITLDLDIILGFDEAGTMISICAESLTIPASLFLG